MARSLIPPAGPARVLAVAQLADSVGLGGYLVSAALYFTTIAGLTPTEMGLGLSVGWGIGMLAGTPLGHLADRAGPRRIGVLLAVVTGLAVGSFLVVRSLPVFLVAACVFAAGQSGLTAARQALLAALVEPEQRTKVRAHLQSVTNAGLALGSALGGIALYVGTTAAYVTVFAAAAVTYGLSALVLLRLPPVAPTPAGPEGEPRLAVLRDRPYAVVSLLNMILLLQLPMLSIAVPLWIVLHTAAPAWTISALLVLNMLAVTVFQVRVARVVRDLTTASRAVRISGLLLLLSCGVFAASSAGGLAWVAVVVLLIAVGLQVFGEMLLSSGAWEISFGLAPDGKHGQYQGFFGSGLAAARAIGPLLLTALLITWGTPGWLVLGAVFLAAGAAMAPAVRWAERSRVTTPRDSPQSQPAAG